MIPIGTCLAPMQTPFFLKVSRASSTAKFEAVNAGFLKQQQRRNYSHGRAIWEFSTIQAPKWTQISCDAHYGTLSGLPKWGPLVLGKPHVCPEGMHHLPQSGLQNPRDEALYEPSYHRGVQSLCTSHAPSPNHNKQEPLSRSHGQSSSKRYQVASCRILMMHLSRFTRGVFTMAFSETSGPL